MGEGELVVIGASRGDRHLGPTRRDRDPGAGLAQLSVGSRHRWHPELRVAQAEDAAPQAARRLTTLTTDAADSPASSGRVRQCGGNSSAASEVAMGQAARGGSLRVSGPAGSGCEQLGHRLGLHVAVLQLPLVVRLQQHGTGQPGDRTARRGRSGRRRPGASLLVQLFERVGNRHDARGAPRPADR